MLIIQGNVNTLRGKPWAQVDLVSDARIEEVVLHIVRWVRKKFPRRPFEVLFPVKCRDLSGIELLYPYILVRTTDLSTLTGVSSVMGVQSLTVNPINGQIVPVDDSYAQLIISSIGEIKKEWSQGIKAGSFVRILQGRERMLCGIVRRVSSGIADVGVSLRLRNVKVRIPVKALFNLSWVDTKEREYFYGG